MSASALDSLASEIAAFITSPPFGSPDDTFNALVCRLFAHQYARNALYRRFCDGRGVLPETIRDWRDIPAAPASAFKRFALTCTPEADCTPERDGRIFHSSGTTSAETSRHYMNADALDSYRVSLRAGYNTLVQPDARRLPIFALMPPPDDAPHSSLSFMLGDLIDREGGAFFWGDKWIPALAAELRRRGKPVTLFGTAFAWVHFFDGATETFVLPPGSRVVETGGFKGRSREVSRDDLYALFQTRLGVPPTHCVSEYGMSEMASQYYDSTLRDAVRRIARPPRKVGPHWLKTRILDPVTGQEAAPGQPGLLVHYDLANLNSVFAIQTEDMGVAADDGDGFTLLGRAPGAVLRGCSLLAE